MKKYIVTVKEIIYRQSIVTEEDISTIAEDVIQDYSEYDWKEVGEPETEVVEIVEENFRKGTLWVIQY